MKHCCQSRLFHNSGGRKASGKAVENGVRFYKAVSSGNRLCHFLNILASCLRVMSLFSGIPKTFISVLSALQRGVFASSRLGLLNIGQKPQTPGELPLVNQVRGVRYGMEYQPNNYQRKRKHGFLKRNKTRAGRLILEKRRKKGRKFLSH